MTDFYSSGSIFQTGTVQAKLEAAGIACNVCEKRIQGNDPSKMVTSLVLQIREEDRGAADKIIHSITQEDRNIIVMPIVCPFCKSDSCSLNGVSKSRVRGIVPFLSGLPAVFPVYRFTCTSCSRSWEIKTGKALTSFKIALWLIASFFLLMFLYALI